MGVGAFGVNSHDDGNVDGSSLASGFANRCCVVSVVCGTCWGERGLDSLASVALGGSEGLGVTTVLLGRDEGAGAGVEAELAFVVVVFPPVGVT